MARSLPQARDRHKFRIESIDDDVAALLIAIEEERVPSQLLELALKLQAALANRKPGPTTD
jgi:hypothetical protein